MKKIIGGERYSSDEEKKKKKQKNIHVSIPSLLIIGVIVISIVLINIFEKEKEREKSIEDRATLSYEFYNSISDSAFNHGFTYGVNSLASKMSSECFDNSEKDLDVVYVEFRFKDGVIGHIPIKRRR